MTLALMLVGVGLTINLWCREASFTSKENEAGLLLKHEAPQAELAVAADKVDEAQTARDKAVDLLLYWSYAMVILAVVAIVISLVLHSIVSPKYLVKFGIIAVLSVLIIGSTYFIVKGSTPEGFEYKTWVKVSQETGAEEQVGYATSDGSITVTNSDLKLTDTVLTLTYLAVGLAIVSILGAAVMDQVNKKKLWANTKLQK